MWRAQAVQPKARRIRHSEPSKIILAIVFAAVFVLTGNTAQACSKDKQAARPTIGHQKVERIMPRTTAVVSAAVIPMVITTLSCSGPCCGAGCHSHGAGCSCSTGSTAIDVSGSTFVFPAAFITVAMFDQGEVCSLKPPPNFRPPCIAKAAGAVRQLIHI